MDMMWRDKNQWIMTYIYMDFLLEGNLYYCYLLNVVFQNQNNHHWESFQCAPFEVYLYYWFYIISICIMSKGTINKSVLLVSVVHWYLVGFREWTQKIFIFEWSGTLPKILIKISKSDHSYKIEYILPHRVIPSCINLTLMISLSPECWNMLQKTINRRHFLKNYLDRKSKDLPKDGSLSIARKIIGN